MDIKLGEAIIKSEDLGFSPDIVPTEGQIAAKVVGLIKERDEALTYREKWEGAVRKLKAYGDAEKRVKDMECDAFLAEAARNFKLNVAQIPFFKKMWQLDSEAVRAEVNQMRKNTYLTEEAGIGGDSNGPVDAEAEVMAKAAELMANDKSLSKGDAMLSVLKKDPELSVRYREAMLSGSGKGGDR